MPLTIKQITRLLKPVREDRVELIRGATYVPQHEVRAELSRVFGPGNWDSRVHDVELLFEEQRESKDGQMRWVVGYRLACTLRVRDFDGNPIAEFTEYHAEENAPLPSRGEAHAFSLTACESYALRRAAIGLGDTFGLHLYNKGSYAALVKGSLYLDELLGREHGPGGDGQPQPAPPAQTPPPPAIARSFTPEGAA